MVTTRSVLLEMILRRVTATTPHGSLPGWSIQGRSDPDQVEAQAKAPFGDPTAEQVEETREHMIRVVARVFIDKLVEHKKSLVQ